MQLLQCQICPFLAILDDVRRLDVLPVVNMDCFRFYNIVTNSDTHYQHLARLRIRF